MGACLCDTNKTIPNEVVRTCSATSVSDSTAQFDIATIKKLSKMSNKEIEKYMKSLEKKESSIIKTLLLGAGSSGKSTLFRQIECIHGEEKRSDTIHGMERFFVDTESMIKNIRLNVINALIKLLKKSQILSQPPYNISKCIIDDTDENIGNAIKILGDFKINKICEFGYDKYTQQDIQTLGESMDLLWKLEGIQETYANRHYFSIYENIDYFLDKVITVMDDSDNNGYIPSMDDVLNARMRTMGIVERSYFIRSTQFNMFDVGGQRNERRKWISLFDNVNVVIFVAALNHYCSVLFEDETVNAMQESIKLFDETVNSQWFSSSKTQWIIFLNKNDLFINRLRDDKLPLTQCFDDYNGLNYADKNNENENENEYFQQCYMESIEFIKYKYLERIKNEQARQYVVVHVTVATQRSNIEKVFNDVTAGIIRKNLDAMKL